MITRKGGWLLLFVASLFSLLTGATTAKAWPDCSLTTLTGTYSGFLQGTLVAPFPGFPPPPLAFAESTMHIYDGAGNVSGNATASVDGVIVPSRFTGTYTVGSDCAYAAELKTSSGLVIHDVGRITGVGIFREIQEIWSVPGTVVNGTLKKAPPGCSLASLNGAYGFLEQGTITVQLPGFPPPPVPYVVVGTITYDGNGNASGNFTINLDGQVTSGTGTGGTYTVSSDCTYTDHLPLSSGLVLIDAGGITSLGIWQEVHYINSGGGFVTVGTAKKRI